MIKSKDKYQCWLFINQNIEERPYEKYGKKASDAFAGFLRGRDYGEGIGLFRFDIYVEPIINYGQHKDGFYLNCAHLSGNLDYNKFISANDEMKYKYLLNAEYILLEYLYKKIAIPKKFQIQKLIGDYRNYLKSNALLLSKKEAADIIIKPFKTTNFWFEITSTIEVKENDIHYNLNEIETYINNNLVGKTFGASIQSFSLGYEIFDYMGSIKPSRTTANLKRYRTSNRELLIVKQFDYQELKNKAHSEQFEILKAKILEAISDVNKMNKKPKDFDNKKFYNVIDDILTTKLKSISN